MPKPASALFSNNPAIKRVIKWIKEPEEFIESQNLVSLPQFPPLVISSTKPSKLYPQQDLIIKRLQDDSVKRLYVGKNRQCGVTQIMLAYALYTVLFAPNKHVMILGCDQSAASRFSESVVKMYTHVLNNNKALVMWFPTTIEQNKQIIRFSNSSTITFGSAKSPHTGHGRALDLLCVDEYGLLSTNEQNDLMLRMLPCVYDGKLVVFSTLLDTYNTTKADFNDHVAAKVQELEKSNFDWSCVFIHRN